MSYMSGVRNVCISPDEPEVEAEEVCYVVTDEAARTMKQNNRVTLFAVPVD